MNHVWFKYQPEITFRLDLFLFYFSVCSSEGRWRPPARHASPRSLRKRRTKRRRHSWRQGERERRLGNGVQKIKRKRWGEGEGGGGGLHGNVKLTLIHLWSGHRAKDLTCADLSAPLGHSSDSSSLHMESNSIYPCAWTRPLRQYQPLSCTDVTADT